VHASASIAGGAGRGIPKSGRDGRASFVGRAALTGHGRGAPNSCRAGRGGARLVHDARAKSSVCDAGGGRDYAGDVYLTPDGRADALAPHPRGSGSSKCFASAHVRSVDFTAAGLVAYAQQQDDCLRGEYAAVAGDVDAHVQFDIKYAYFNFLRSLEIDDGSSNKPGASERGSEEKND